MTMRYFNSLSEARSFAFDLARKGKKVEYTYLSGKADEQIGRALKYAKKGNTKKANAIVREGKLHRITYN